MKFEELKEKLRGKLAGPVALIGYGTEGKSTLKLLLDCGFEGLTVLDKNAQELPEGVRGVFGENYLGDLAPYRTVVRSAGVKPTKPELLRFAEAGGTVTSQIQLFFDLVEGKILGTTGTMGKGTTTMMISACLDEAGVPHEIGGNIGTPVLEILRKEEAAPLAVLELSSFQLMDLKASPDVAVVVRTTCEHLDWHTDVREYRMAKARLVANQKPGQLCVFCGDAEGSREIAERSPARKVSYGRNPDAALRLDDETLFLPGNPLPLSECAIAGSFMLENMAAAALAAQELGASEAAVRAALAKFEGLQYRLQFKGEANGIGYWNDSYATRPEAALAAARSVSGPLAMILGGSEKNADFTELFDGLAALPDLALCALIGQTAKRIGEGLAPRGVPCIHCNSLEDAVRMCEEALPNGGDLLLSPACASFGMFKNYKERGAIFDRIVAQRT